VRWPTTEKSCTETRHRSPIPAYTPHEHPPAHYQERKSPGVEDRDRMEIAEGAGEDSKGEDRLEAEEADGHRDQ